MDINPKTPLSTPKANGGNNNNSFIAGYKTGINSDGIGKGIVGVSDISDIDNIDLEDVLHAEQWVSASDSLPETLKYETDEKKK